MGIYHYGNTSHIGHVLPIETHHTFYSQSDSQSDLVLRIFVHGPSVIPWLIT